MDDLISKKLKDCKKIKDSIIRRGTKVKKNTNKKQKKRENFKTSIGTVLFSEIFKPGLKKGLGKLRIKASQGIEGMFFKGLRSNYINRKALNEANEARKNEDINKIIDLGKGFFEKERHFERPSKRVHGDEPNEEELIEKQTKFSSDSIKGLEYCPLSPISSVASAFKENKIKGSSKNNTLRELELEKEFVEFSRKYEEFVGTHVLQRLPSQNGVLEVALNTLRKKAKFTKTESQKASQEFLGDEIQFSKEFEFSAQDFELEKPAAEDFIKNFIFSENLLDSKTNYYCESFTENSLEKESLKPDFELENYHYLPFQSKSDNEDKNLSFFAFQIRKFDNSPKDLILTTPPIQFYRRNMF